MNLTMPEDKVDLGGYYLLDENKAVAAMRPSETLNSILK